MPKLDFKNGCPKCGYETYSYNELIQMTGLYGEPAEASGGMPSAFYGRGRQTVKCDGCGCRRYRDQVDGRAPAPAKDAEIDVVTQKESKQ